MILGIGIDSVDISRFIPWRTYTNKKLKRFLNNEEIAYCLSTKTKNAERFAVRFAAKETLYKALCSANLFVTMPSFLSFARHVTIAHQEGGAPFIATWQQLQERFLHNNKVTVHLSLTHTKTVATAIVLLEQHP